MAKDKNGNYSDYINASYVKVGFVWFTENVSWENGNVHVIPKNSHDLRCKSKLNFTGLLWGDRVYSFARTFGVDGFGFLAHGHPRKYKRHSHGGTIRRAVKGAYVFMLHIH